MNGRDESRLFSFVLLLALLCVTCASQATAQRPQPRQQKAPALIVRDTGGFAGPSFNLVVFGNLEWKFNAVGENKSGKMEEAKLDGLIEKLKEAGIEKAESIRPSPAPHSQIMIKRGKTKVNVFLNQSDALMVEARELATDAMK